MAERARLEDGFQRVSNTLELAYALFDLTGAAEKVLHLIKTSAWGHATRDPGYTCRFSVQQIVAYLSAHVSQASIYRAIQELRDKTILEADPDSLTLNPRCVQALSPQDLVTLGLMMNDHNDMKSYSRPKLVPINPILTDKKNILTDKNRLYKDARAGRERERLKSSSYLTGNNLENTVPNSQTADDDEFKAQSQRLRQELVRLAAQRARKAESELAASIDGITGKTPHDLALGMARLIDRMRADERWGPINLRGLLVTASDPSNGNWGNATVESVLSSLRPVAQAPQPVDQDALYAAARAAEREQRMRQT